MSYNRGYSQESTRNFEKEYKCFGCNISFVTKQKAPKCQRCGQTLKGRAVGGNQRR